MNVLFVLYGDFSSNSAIPLALHARELHRSGHQCAVALPSGLEIAAAEAQPALRPLLYGDALADPAAIFPDGRPADILHAWTPREGVRRFVTAYLAMRPTPWVIYLEDNEGWLARAALGLVGLREDVLLQHSEEVITTWTPQGLPHPLRYESFIGLADAAVVIQDKLSVDVPPWVSCTTVMPGVDLELFSPRPGDPSLRARYGVAKSERVIVYPGGLNDFTRPGLEAICRAVGLINRSGVPCRLLRTGPVALDFLDRLPPEATAAVTDLGVLPRGQMPDVLAMSDVFVQPGRLDPFEDLRLPGKLPELFATGRPVVLPDANIASLLQDGVNAVIHRTGSPEEISARCMELFADPDRARKIGEGGRRFAETHFDPKVQASRLENVYRAARDAFDPKISRELWSGDAQNMPVPALLARKLRLLARADDDHALATGAMLETHAHSIELALERSQGLETGMAVRDREIGILKAEVGARGEQIARLAETVDNLGAQFAASSKAVADLTEELARSTQTVTEQTGQLARSKQAIIERDHRISALESSLSWRITRPLRIAGQIVLRLASFFNFLAQRNRLAADLTLHPMASDPALARDENGHAYWHADSCDPAFIASMPPGEPPLTGWYRARVKVVERSGHLAGPRLYIPFPGGGYSEYRSAELKLEGGSYVAEFFTSGATSHLRFDPSIYPCDFECDAIELVPIERRRWTQSGRSVFQAIRRLKSRQLALWFRQGLAVLFSRGPMALWEAAYWALANHARATQGDYAAWVRQFATPSPADLSAMAEECARFARQPTVSFVTPVYNTAEPYLRAMIDSVIAQAYPRWELCLADDASTAPHVRRVLEEYRTRDPRIKVALRDSNGHISAASNTALEIATGDFVALLDHDDAIAPDALYWVVKELNDHPDAALLYSDEDKLDFDGARIMPYFKCDWNYDLFLSHNLITHLGVYRADIVREIGGFRVGFEGAQDYDLALRFIERIEPSQIRHIPRILYQWRMLRGSTSVGAGEKDYAAGRARLAIDEHLRRIGVAASVETIPEMAVQRVRYRLPQPAPLASIIIPTRNGHKLVRQCIESLRKKTTYAPYEILLVDNGSDEKASLEYFHALRDEGVVRLLEDPRPFNFSRINNLAARQAGGEYLVFLNNDIEVISPDWLSELISHAQRAQIGAAGAKLWYPNETIQHAGLVLVAGLAAHAHHGKRRGDHGYFSRASLIQSLSAVTAACLCIRKKVFDEIGGFDETLAVAFNDVDLCLRIQAAGYRNLYTPYAELYHHESASRGYEDTPEKMARFQKEADILRARWMPVLMSDPYYNPNLTLSGEPFTLAWPPRVEPFKATKPPVRQ